MHLLLKHFFLFYKINKEKIKFIIDINMGSISSNVILNYFNIYLQKINE